MSDEGPPEKRQRTDSAGEGALEAQAEALVQTLVQASASQADIDRVRSRVRGQERLAPSAEPA